MCLFLVPTFVVKANSRVCDLNRSRTVCKCVTSIGYSNATWAEFWGLLLGVRLARELGLSLVQFEVDSQVVVSCAHAAHCSVAAFQPILKEMFSMLQLPGWTTHFM